MDAVRSLLVHEYSPLDMPNPTLSRYYRVLELVALAGFRVQGLGFRV